MVIDSHVHVYPEELIRDQEKISRVEPHFDLLTHNRVHKWGNTEDLIAKMDEEGVDQSWIFGFAFKDLGLCRLCNDYVLESVKKYPHRLKALAVVPPLAPGATKEIERCSDHGIIGVGELFPQGQLFDLDDQRQTWRLVGACDERDLFMVIHTAEPVGHDYDGKGNVGPKEAAQFCLNHPEARVVFAHWGGGLWLYENMPEMKLALKNAYYDTAAWPWLYSPDVIKAAFTSGLGHKILYGSDFPILSYKRYRQLLAKSAISDSEVSMVTGENASLFLKDMKKTSF